MADDETIKALLEPVLRRRLHAFGFDHADIRIGKDHDGDPTIFVVANYEPNAAELNAAISLDLAVELNRLLQEKGDERFVHLTHFWPDDPPAQDEIVGQKKRFAGSRR